MKGVEVPRVTVLETLLARSKGHDDARERVLAAAYELFRLNGTRNIGVDRIVERSGVAKMSLYRHFKSKEGLVSAFLERREELWTIGWLQAEVCKRAAAPADRLLAVFDVFDEWFRSQQFDGCSFISVLLEYPSDHPTHVRAALHLANIRSFLRQLAREAAIADPQAFAETWHTMMKGSIVAACEGNLNDARQIKIAAELFLTAHRGPAGPDRVARYLV
jgi:AcrR family transcriptional regulator